MKRSLVIPIITGIAALLLFCSNALAQPEILWEKVYMPAGYKPDHNSKIYITKKDAIIRYGRYNCPDCDFEHKPVITKFDSNGKLIWETIMDIDYPLFPDFMHEDENGDLVLISDRPLKYKYDSIAQKYYNQYYTIQKSLIDNSTGRMIDNKFDSTVFGSPPLLVPGVNFINNKNQIIKLSFLSYKPPNPLIARIYDENCRLINEIELNNTIEKQFQFEPELICNLDSDSEIIAGIKFNLFSKQFNSFLMKVDNQGRNLSSKEVDTKEYIYEINSANQIIFVLGKNFICKPYLGKYDQHLTEEKKIIIEEDSIETIDMEVTERGNILVLINYPYPGNEFSLFLYNGDLELKMHEKIKKESFLTIFGMKRLANGDFIIHGKIRTNYYLARINNPEK